VAETVAKAQGGDAKGVARNAVQATATGRFTEPHDVADLILLLASDRTSNVSGADFVVDGGLVQTL
jgi:NAD(P)-dependent dehydrogenase (short-subunit alcohol dehydrogenase family)